MFFSFSLKVIFTGYRILAWWFHLTPTPAPTDSPPHHHFKDISRCLLVYLFLVRNMLSYLSFFFFSSCFKNFTFVFIFNSLRMVFEVCVCVGIYSAWFSLSILDLFLVSAINFGEFWAFFFFFSNIPSTLSSLLFLGLQLCVCYKYLIPCHSS